MIEIATILDETRAGQRRAAGRMIRRKILIAVDRFNIVLAESTDDGNPIGRKFMPRLASLAQILPEFGVDLQKAEKALSDGFEQLFGDPIKQTTLAGLDEQFKVSKRTDNSTGELLLYRHLKEMGLSSGSDDDGDE